MKIPVDRTLFIVFIAIIIYGLFIQYSVSISSQMIYFKKTILWIVISIPICFLIVNVKTKIWIGISYILYGIGLLLLLIPLFSHYAVKRWISLGGFSFQPSELAKFFLILALSRYFFSKKEKGIRPKDIFIPFVMTFIPFLLTMLEPDLGTSLMFVAIFIGYIFSMEISIFQFFLLLSPFLSVLSAFNYISWAIFFVLLILSLYFSRTKLQMGLIVVFLNLIIGGITPILWNSLKEYQKKRIVVFFKPDLDPGGAGWQIVQSRIAIGSGGFFGKGYLKGAQKALSFIPQQHTDFIFTVIGEELGFVGSFILIFLYFLLLWRILIIGLNSRNRFNRNVCFGIFIYFLVQVFTNIGMTVGLLPIVGIPLPFFSYGGSSMLISILMVAFVLRTSQYIYEY